MLRAAFAVLQLVTRLQMLDKGTAIINWELRGQLGACPINISFTSTFLLDLITGRVRLAEPMRSFVLSKPLSSILWQSTCPLDSAACTYVSKRLFPSCFSQALIIFAALFVWG